jgi:hypothetical protein
VAHCVNVGEIRKGHGSKGLSTENFEASVIVSNYLDSFKNWPVNNILRRLIVTRSRFFDELAQLPNEGVDSLPGNRRDS